MTINTRWFRIDLLSSKKDWFWPGWRWRPRFTRPWDRGRALTWGNWHFVITRRWLTAAERRKQREDYRAAVKRMQAWSEEEGWEFRRPLPSRG